MDGYNNNIGSCIQVSASLASESPKVSAILVGASIIASATLATDTLQASAWAYKTIIADAYSLYPPLKVTAGLVCDVGEMAPVEGLFFTADGMVFFTADNLMFESK